LKTLKDILYKVGLLEVKGDMLQTVSNIAVDSRIVTAGDLFVAVRGTLTDGHKYIEQAIEKGATSVVCEEMPEETADGITFMRVKDSSLALGIIAANFYDNPSESLKIIGITGTNGKTSIATLLFSLFTKLGYNCSLISTIKIMVGTKELPATHTTPDALALNKLFSVMVRKGIAYCFMEVSSHAIDQQRIAGIVFSGGVFTNLTHDHLDYHHSFEAYRDTKKRFFDDLPSTAFALSNADDRNGRFMLQNTKGRIFHYGLKSMADFRCRIIENRFNGLQLTIDGVDIWFRLVGQFNAYNLLAVYACAVLLGESRENILTVLSDIMPIEGRFDHFISTDGIIAIVDYAHSPDALENVLKTVNSVRTGNEQLITVIGAGGNRDTAKRPVMASIACNLSNRVILTSDNPRFEEPEAIIEEMKKGIPADKKRTTLSITNRLEAIKAACAMAEEGDIILVAGKGHEKYQEIKGVKYPFDDKKILHEILNPGAINKDLTKN